MTKEASKQEKPPKTQNGKRYQGNNRGTRTNRNGESVPYVATVGKSGERVAKTKD